MKNIRNLQIHVDLLYGALPVSRNLKQGDTTRLTLTVFRGGKSYPLESLTPILNAKRADKLIYIQTSDYDVNDNSITYNLAPQIVAEPGRLQLEIELDDADGNIISSFTIGITVEPRLFNGEEDVAPDDQNEIIDAARAAAKSATEAMGHSNSASESAARASGSADDARASALSAANSVSSADTSATAAAASAEASADSATNAAISADHAEQVTSEAKQSAVSAETAANAAIEAKERAESAKSSAKSSADRADAYASSAAKSAANAAESATNAAGSASAAATAKTAAEAAKQSAESARDSAALSKTNAAKSEESAANSAKAAEQAASGAVGAVNSAGATQVERVENAGNRAVGDVNAVADAKKAEIEQLDLVEEVNQVSEAISNLEGFVLGTANLKSWKEVQELIRAGLAPKILKVGDQLECQRDGVKLTWDIIGLDCDTPVNPGLTHSMTLQLHDGWKSLQFDAAEALYYCETELAAGTYNFTLLAGYDTTYGGGKTYSFTLANAVPAGGVIMFPWRYQKQAAETKISTYASRESTTVIESVSVTEGANGTSLGTADGKSANMNHTHRIRYGSNKYSTSAMRQLLNSDAAAGKVWTPQTIYDRPPTWAATQNGFLAGLDPDFLAVVADVKKRTALNTITDGGGYEDTVEKFFLLSRSEVYAGLENSVNEGNPYPYYSDFSDLSAAGSGEDGNRIKYMDGVAKYWWLRSPHASYAYHVRTVTMSGTLSTDSAYYAQACAPACTIA